MLTRWKIFANSIAVLAISVLAGVSQTQLNAERTVPTSSRPEASLPIETNQEDLLYLGERPILIRLHVRVDDKPWRKVRDDLVHQHFRDLDQNVDDRVSAEELKAIQLDVPSSLDDLSKWDTEPNDGELSLVEFSRLYDELGPPPFLLAEGAGPAASRIRLFPHLDVNEDGRITPDELKDASSLLYKLDYDEDETISTTELAPFRNPLVPQRILARDKPLSVDAPFLAFSTFRSAHDLARAALHRFVPPTQDGLEMMCPIEAFGSAREEIASYDGNQDGQISVAEMANYLTDCPRHFELQVDLPLKRFRRPKLKVIRDTIQLSNRRSSRRPTSRIQMQVGNTEFQLRGVSTRSKSRDNDRFYLQRFLVADEDKNGYVDASEFPQIQLDATFDQLDRDRNEQINRNELQGYLNRDAFASHGQVVLSVAADTLTLFTVLDTNTDQRLAPRELRRISSQLRTIDSNRDGSIATSEIAHRYRLTFSLGRPRVFRQMQSTNPTSNVPVPQPTQIDDAPAWFTKMDRNQDGDLSWREFLGPRREFTKMDLDQNELISVDEIEPARENKSN